MPGGFSLGNKNPKLRSRYVSSIRERVSILNGLPSCSFCFRLDNAIPRIEHAISRITSTINLNFCISYLIIIHDIRAIFLKKTASYFICVFLSFFSQTPVFNIVLVRAYVKIAHPPRLPRRGRRLLYKLSFYCGRLRRRPQTKSLLFVR